MIDNYYRKDIDNFEERLREAIDQELKEKNIKTELFLDIDLQDIQLTN